MRVAHHEVAWTTAAIASARRLWDSGMSASAIGEALGRTKNSVCGMARRNEFPMRGSPIKDANGAVVPKKRGTPREFKAPKPKPAPKPVAPPRLELAPVPLPAVTRTIFKPRALTVCCWPFGDPKASDFRFCDAVARPGKPYCAEHYGIAYRQRDAGDPLAPAAPALHRSGGPILANVFDPVTVGE